MKLHVKIIAPGPPVALEMEKPILFFNAMVDKKQTFGDAWNIVIKQLSGLYSGKVPHHWEIKKLQDKAGFDIDTRDPIGDFFEDEGSEDRIVRVIMTTTDRECSIAQGSFLRPKFVRERQLSTPERERIKRRKTHEERYGAVAEELDPDRPVTSREPEQAVSEEEAESEAEAQQVDADGFRIPQKKNNAHKRSHAEYMEDDDGQVMVKDSQGERGPHAWT